MTERSCADCGKSPLGRDNRTGLCRTCCAARVGGRNARPDLKRECQVCGKALVRSTTGHCRPCFNAKLNSDPEARARQADGIRRFNRENPLALKVRGIRSARTRKNNPEYMAKLRELVRTRVQPQACTPDAVARRDAKKRGDAISAAKLPWCPAEWREHYRMLRYKAFTPAEAKQMTLQAMREAEERLSPFERQMRALERGAKLIEMAPRATLDRPGVFRS